MEPTRDQVLEAWRTNHRINLFLIDQISDEGMRCTLSKRGGRPVHGQLTHLHNLRIWLLEGRAADLAEGLEKFSGKAEPDKEALKQALVASGERIETFLAECMDGKPGRRTFKKGVVTHLGYLIAHESHHRGNILLTLKTCGHHLEKKARDAIWNWDKM